MLFNHRKRRRLVEEIHPDEILIDSSNLPEFDRDQMEGRIERPFGRRSFIAAGAVVALVLILLLARAGVLQLVRGTAYAKMSEDNQLSNQVLFADRGIITDRNGTPLAYNSRTTMLDTTDSTSTNPTEGDASSTPQEFATRVYADYRGLAHVVGYAQPPAKDSYGVYFRNTFLGVDGAEKAFDAQLGGKNGEKLTETDAHHKTIAESVVNDAVPGQQITLSIDADVTQGLYDAIAERAQSSNFQGGAGVLIDVQTGQILAMTSYPEYSQNAVESGDATVLKQLFSNKQQPFLDRAVDGLYAPGSIVKPVVGAAALTEGVISPDKQILSTGSISLPNQYDPAHPSVFHDWRANGWVDVRHAIAVSSDVYFYEVGGGFEGQPGLGVDRLDKYFRMFGFGQDAGLAGFSSKTGNIPTIAWKAATFPNDPTWHVGDTYHTAIGQYGMLVTPLQAAREAAAIANGGTLLTPSVLASSTPQGQKLAISPDALEVVREGMRLGVTDGIAQAVKLDAVHVAAKTGTAQVGMHNEFVNSWMIGFFPYEHPRYAYAVVLERGPAGTLMGSPAVVGTFLQWMVAHEPQYLH